MKNRFITTNSTLQTKWVLFILLCLIWGSSFVLMKLGLFASDGSPLLSPWQVAAIRILTSGLVLIPFFLKSWQKIPPEKRWVVLLSGWIGSFIPAILFCIAETKIDSALAGMLNAVTPLSTLFLGWVIYRVPVAKWKLAGILVGLTGCILLFWHTGNDKLHHPMYASMVLIATLCYGWNGHMVRQKLMGISALDIATMAFAGLVPFSFMLLFFSGYFSLPLMQPEYMRATFAASILGIAGTAFASVLFYKLVKMAGPVFASLVTYGIPFVAVGWGVVYGEVISLIQLVALTIILAGVYIANKEKQKKDR